ncbi:hypothetical protein [Natronoglomus mannanivorans]|uniref:Uncharacterized protein n=1 Tax=Natronoglomus mannanivorans TaxID=2979990 RepID=A0AAP2YWV3_9EURY|nr:hypothetical protein [Halobacteria archaeon AArc-xg1-1]
MLLGRRTAFAALGLGVSSVGFWQRRRIARRPALETFATVRAIPVPTVEAGAIVTDAHLEASLERVQRTVDEASALPDVDRDDLPELAVGRPDELADASHADRRRTLEDWRAATEDVHASVAEFRYPESIDETDVETRLERERAALTDLEVETEYYGRTFTDAVVQHGEAEARYRRAGRRLELTADRELDGVSAYRLAWRYLERAAAERHDGTWFAAGIDHATDTPARDESDDTDRITRTLETVRESVASSREAVDVTHHHEEVERNYASTIVWRWLSTRDVDRVGGVPSTAIDLRDACRAYTFLQCLDAFVEIPAPEFWSESDWTVAVEALEPAKRRAIERITAATDEYGNDPLGRWLLAVAVDRLEDGDRCLERAANGANNLSADDWRERRLDAFLQYRLAGVFADRIGETMALVAE